tara:strand:+ start:3794 stop:4624 length:831 start_codon:yes stop_codon:yes gene_type:complete
MKKSCTLLLQRNLPEVTEKFAETLLKYNADVTDLYVIESGSDDNNLTKFNTFHANWEDAKKNGLRTGRGFNYGLKTLLEKNLDYDFIMMATGDTQLPEEPSVEIMLEEMEVHKKMGILAPVTWNWNTRISSFRDKQITKAMGIQLPHICWLFRKECIEDITKGTSPSIYDEFLYDGTNFRCYGADTEIMMKAYRSDWFFGVTSKTTHKEDYDLTDQNYKKMKTDSHNMHRKLMWEEGKEWMLKKFGCATKNEFNSLLWNEYLKFFSRNSDLVPLMY